MRIAISSGHGLYVRGARGDPVPPQLDEVDEARRVVDRVAQLLAPIGVVTFHDDVSTTQSANLDRIVDWHNDQDRTLDVSVHFNAYDGSAHGTEVLYVTQDELASELSQAIALAGAFTDRGGKKRTDLAFLNGTEEPAVLIEVCFCDNTDDSQHYRLNFENICHAITEVLSGEDIEWQPPVEPPVEPDDETLFYARGTCSTFGGPDDTGVAEDEGLAFIYDIDEAPHLFLPEPPQGVGLARSLDAERAYYIACRWNYQTTPKGLLADPRYKAAVTANGITIYAYPADWGPHESTGRVADLSPALAKALGVSTDDVVEVRYPA